jgi:hypothetical protein
VNGGRETSIEIFKTNEYCDLISDDRREGKIVEAEV